MISVGDESTLKTPFSREVAFVTISIFSPN
jgi:hypothetical protein